MDGVIKEVLRIGEILKERYLNVNPHNEKEPGHLLAQADLEIHEELSKSLSLLYPGIPVDSEESLKQEASSSSCFIIDPIDGTNNFLCGRPFFAISVAFEDHGKILWALIYNPVSGELFHANAEEDYGYYNYQPIKVPGSKPIEESLFFLGLSYGSEKYTAYLNRWQRLLEGLRKCFFETAPALSICNAALGRIQGFIDSGCSSHGQSAAALVLQKAGGCCLNYDLTRYDHQAKGGIFLSANMKEGFFKAIE